MENKTNLFSKLLPYLGSMNINLSITKGEQDITVVFTPSVLNDVKDKATNNLKPLIISGSVEELDEQFLEVIAKPIGEVAGLLKNIAEFEKAKEIADKEKLENKSKVEKAEKEQKELTESANKLLEKIKESNDREDNLKKIEKFLKDNANKNGFNDNKAIKKLKDKETELKPKAVTGSLF